MFQSVINNNIFINDVKSVDKFLKIPLYKDDMKIYYEITNNIDLLHLQIDKININKWVEDNGLDFNIFKCKTVLHALEP